MSAADRSEASSRASSQAFQAVGAERTVGQLFASATADLSALVHDEIALAKAEIGKDVKRGLTGSGVGIVAAVIAVAAIPMFSFFFAYGLHALGVSLWLSFLIVAVAYLVIASVAGFLAYRFFKKVSPPDRTIASTKATVDVLKGAKPHPAAPVTVDGHKILTP
jgi:hypothetical protein